MTLLPAAPAISPLVSAGLGLAKGVFGFLGGRSKAKRQNALEMQKFVRLRKAAEDGGFHPLEALRSGQQVNATAGPRLFSSLANSNAFDALEDELTGEGAKQRKREQVEDEIRERELDKQRYDVAQQQITQPSGTRTSPRLAPADSTLGDGSSVEETRDIPAGVTNIQPGSDKLDDADVDFQNPWRGDAAGIQQRYGENELAEPFISALMWLDKVQYNRAVTELARVKGITRREAHAAVANDPYLLKSLPSMSVIFDQKAKDAAKLPPMQGPSRGLKTVLPRLDPSFSQRNIPRN